ncbi:MAG: hypothetical protein JWP88_2001 [Flaviaesturariibacter sp.]|nr:hypothetical protein [Flaviaesturariibacter sp.]
MQTRALIKENGTWYINLNIGDGDVMQKIPFRKGADIGLDLLAAGKERLLVSFDTTPFENAIELELLRLRPRGEGGGGYYLLRQFGGREVNLELVLNAAIEYVFGSLPKRIFLRQEPDSKK